MNWQKEVQSAAEKMKDIEGGIENYVGEDESG